MYIYIYTEGCGAYVGDAPVAAEHAAEAPRGGAPVEVPHQQRDRIPGPRVRVPILCSKDDMMCGKDDMLCSKYDMLCSKDDMLCGECRSRLRTSSDTGSPVRGSGYLFKSPLV